VYSTPSSGSHGKAWRGLTQDKDQGDHASQQDEKEEQERHPKVMRKRPFPSDRRARRRAGFDGAPSGEREPRAMPAATPNSAGNASRPRIVDQKRREQRHGGEPERASNQSPLRRLAVRRPSQQRPTRRRYRSATAFGDSPMIASHRRTILRHRRTRRRAPSGRRVCEGIADACSREAAQERGDDRRISHAATRRG